MTRSSWISSQDTTSNRRIIQGTVQQKNLEALEKTGRSQYYIEDPVAAAYAKGLESKKLLRDSQYLDTVKDFGTRLKGGGDRRGMIPINHPELEGKTVVIAKDGKAPIVVRHGDLLYPPEIASKVQSRIGLPPLTGFTKAWSDYNKVFRSAVFASSPGMRIGNSLDNMYKTMAVSGGKFMEASKGALASMLGKDAGFTSEANSLRPSGKFYSAQEFKALADRFGMTHTGSWSEGIAPLIETGKKMTFAEAGQDVAQFGPRYAMQRAQSLIKAVDVFGQRGENMARLTLFRARLMAGWEPEMAANEVTKYLFDYSRNSQAMNNVRFVMPFMQHPGKTLMATPALLSQGAGAYNFIQNTFPHVIANAFHDPLAQQAIQSLLPPNIKARDGIAGPWISGNTWMAAVFGGKQGGPFGQLTWFDPRIGLRIDNHVNYLDKGGSDRFVGELSPVLQAVLSAGGRGDWGKSLDWANGNVNIANRFEAALSHIVGGVLPFPNAEKMIAQGFGLVDEKYVEPNTVLMLKGMAGQFGGITNFDKDVNSKLLTLKYAIADQKKQFISTVRSELGSTVDPKSIAGYVKEEYGQITGMEPGQVWRQLQLSQMGEQSATSAAQYLMQQKQQQDAPLGSGKSAGDYAARIIGMTQEMARVNQAYRTMGAMYLQRSQGAKNADEARAKAGLTK